MRAILLVLLFQFLGEFAGGNLGNNEIEVSFCFVFVFVKKNQNVNVFSLKLSLPKFNFFDHVESVLNTEKLFFVINSLMNRYFDENSVSNF